MTEYLVLKPFKSYGVFYKKGDVVKAEAIRNVRIRVSESKLLPIVPESGVPSSIVPDKAAAQAAPGANKVAKLVLKKE